VSTEASREIENNTCMLINKIMNGSFKNNWDGSKVWDY
jgi:hypothetical protein